MFERMEISEQVYSGVTPYKKPIKEDSNCASHVKKINRGEAASPTNPNKGRTVKRKTKNAGHASDCPNGGKKWLLHGPGHSMEECKLLKE